MRKMAAVAVTAMMLAGCGAAATNEPQQAAPEPTATPIVIVVTPEPAVEVEATEEPTAEPTLELTPVPAKAVTVKGKGSQKTKAFPLSGDYAVTISGKATDTWGGNVIVDLALKGGDGFFDNENLWNEIVDRGKYSFTTMVYGVDGTYYVDASIMPGGSWTITFKPEG